MVSVDLRQHLKKKKKKKKKKKEEEEEEKKEEEGKKKKEEEEEGEGGGEEEEGGGGECTVHRERAPRRQQTFRVALVVKQPNSSANRATKAQLVCWEAENSAI